jgi:uncharacterized protein YbcI
MVKLLKNYVGRGPDYARAYIHDEVIFVVLRRTMTKAERTLADEGQEALVRSVRRALQGRFREDANEIIERLTGRRVCAFLSDYDVNEDAVVQAFMLEPRPGRSFGPGPGKHASENGRPTLDRTR